MAVGDKIFVADKDTLDAVNTKCTTIQTNTNNLNSRLTSTRAGYLDYLANGTYGLNAIKNAINTVDNNVDSIKTYTTTNNTASKTGILSQKSTYIINMLENTTYGLNAIKSSANASELFPSLKGTGNTIFDNNNTLILGTIPECIIKFIAPVDGIYNINITAKTNSTTVSRDIQPYIVKEGTYYTSLSTDANRIRILQKNYYDAFDVGDNINRDLDNNDVSGSTLVSSVFFPIGQPVTVLNSTVCKWSIYCKMGEPIVIVMVGNSGQTYPIVTHSTVTYG